MMLKGTSLSVAVACSVALCTQDADAQSINGALELYQDGDYEEAATLFFDVLLNDANRDRRDQAEIYLAETLRKLGLLVPALFYYQDVFKLGRNNNRYYLNAVEGLLAVQEVLRDQVFVPNLLDRHFDADGFGQLEPGRIAQINYLIGELSFRRQQNKDAKDFLEYVPPESALYPKARYLLGILAVRRNNTKEALTHFKIILEQIPQDAATEELRGIRHLTLVAAARVAYGLKKFDLATEYYKQVPRFSEHWFTAIYENAWSHFQRQEYGKALGELQSAASPYFAKRHIPEAYVIQGIAYFSNCQWDRVRRAVDHFNKLYEPMGKGINRYLAAKRSPVEYYRDAVAGGSGKYSIEIARDVRRKKRFKEYHHMVNHMAWEEEAITDMDTWRNSRIAEDARLIIQQQRQQLVPVVGAWLKTRLLFLKQQLQHFQSQINILDFEVTDAERRWLEEGKEILKGRRARAPRPDIPNDQWQHWKFAGEFWKDELGYYAHSLRTECF